MKVLYIGYYKENSEWGKMATNFILSMHAAGIEVVPRAIELSPAREVGGIVAQLEKGDVESCDICIQHVFPEHFVGSEKFKKNIAIFTNDFIEIRHTSAIEKLNQATEIWVTNEGSRDVLSECVSVPVKIVHPGCKEEVYKQAYQKVELGEEVDDTFRFYTVTNSIPERDNVIATFHGEFDSAEPVSLIVFSTSQDREFAKKINAWSTESKSKLRIKQDPQMFKADAILHMPESSEKDVYALHRYGHCYVSSSQGDAWPVTAFDAACFGNTPIMANAGGASEFCDPKFLVPSVTSVNLAAGKPSEVRNGRDYTVTPCHKSIRAAMRLAYEEYKQNPIQSQKTKSIEGLQTAERFSLKESGNKIKELLNV